MAKRKRAEAANGNAQTEQSKKPKAVETSSAGKVVETGPKTVQMQVVTGSYDRILHGIIITIDSDEKKASFADNFLFNAHNSAIRCVAVSAPSAPKPRQKQKVFLASGSTDERVNVYALSAHPPSGRAAESIPRVTPRPIVESRRNKEVGSLMHHGSSVTGLCFPTRGKLLSCSEDSTVAITRTRDWSLLGSVKAPIPRAHGRPSGDTAQDGSTPSGVNDFAVHKGLEAMISVSKGERCMRLWDLRRGKRAGVLNFEKAMLRGVGEGRFSTGEGSKVVWGSTKDSEEFAIAFERNVVVFDMERARAKCKVFGEGETVRVCGLRYVETAETSLLVVSTEDGRICFFHTAVQEDEGDEAAKDLPVARMVAQIGGKEEGVVGRVKDFVALVDRGVVYVVGGSSDGRVRVWQVEQRELDEAVEDKEAKGKRLGKFLGSSETQNRITCLDGYVMVERPEGVEDSEDEFEDSDDDEDEDEEDQDEDEDKA